MAKSSNNRIITHAHRQRLHRAAEVYLQRCYEEQQRATVAGFAALLRRNPEYMTRTSVRISGATLLAYLRIEQLKEAERLLITTPLTVAEIAMAAAFGDPATLWRSFKRYRGMSPSDIRKVRNCKRN